MRDGHRGARPDGGPLPGQEARKGQEVPSKFSTPGFRIDTRRKPDSGMPQRILFSRPSVSGALATPFVLC
jgi:hypothetical protein